MNSTNSVEIDKSGIGKTGCTYSMTQSRWSLYTLKKRLQASVSFILFHYKTLKIRLFKHYCSEIVHLPIKEWLHWHFSSKSGHSRVLRKLRTHQCYLAM